MNILSDYYRAELSSAGSASHHLVHLLFLASRMMSVASEIKKTKIIITKVNQELDCNVCQMAPYKCYPETLKLFAPCNVSVEFTCPRPQDVFSVEVNREIGM